MKIDKYGCMIREKYIDGHPANLGDSCAETCRMFILLNGSNPFGLNFLKFVLNTWLGPIFLRHPDLIDKPGWDTKDFTNDQYLPLLLVYDKFTFIGNRHIRPGLLIPGTKTLISPGVWAASRGHFMLLNLFNIVQGFLFNFRWRWSDDEKLKGKLWKFERSKGKIQDWLNYAAVFIFLQQTGRWSTLNQPKQRLFEAIEQYYLGGNDWEPNAEWIVEHYMDALNYHP